MKKSITAFLVFYALALMAQFGGTIFTSMGVGNWYLTLNRSALTPPGYVFGLVWTLLYLLMAIAVWRVWRAENGRWWTPAQRLWLLQLAIGFSWNIVFFGLHQPVFGMAVILVTWLAAVATTWRFFGIDRSAGMLMLLVVLWLTFANYLQLYIAYNN
jgi:tryptophan-rich sensory protein